ncbi:MAG: histidine kinase, partial [Candidatus Marinimicrobia bacterium]|nr:histidine kinase [Candidatus Neomarinimicrobiota bacterium]
MVYRFKTSANRRLEINQSTSLFKSIILLLLIIMNVYAQKNDIEFEHVSIGQELTQSTVYCICQDTKGFIWLGTDDGLKRYDGYNLKVYRFKSNNPNSLSSNFVWSVFEDSYGHLWVGTVGGGVNRFDREKEKFIHYQNNPEDPNSLSNNFVRCFYENKKRELWIGTDNGLNKLSLDSIYSGKFDSTSSPFFTHYKNDPRDKNSLSHNEIRSICEDQFGDLWVGTWGGGINRVIFDTTADRENSESRPTFIRYNYDPDNHKSLGHNRIWSIYEDISGELWIGTDGGGLNKFDREREQFIRFQVDPKNPNSINSNIIVTIYEDQSHTLWVGTDGGGLNKYDRNINAFSHYQKDPFNPNSISHNVIRSIFEDRCGVLWIGTMGGLNKHTRLKKFMHYKSNPTNPNSLSHNEVRGFYEDFDENRHILWIATDGGGLNQFDRNKNQFVHYRHDPDDPGSLSDDVVLCVYKDRSGVMWIGTYKGGLNRFVPPDLSGLRKGNKKNKPVFTHYKNNPNNPNSLSSNFVRSVYEDQEGMLWICTSGGGLNKYDREKGIFTRYLNDPDNPKSLSHNILLFTYEDRSGQFWIGTWGGGLDKFNRKTEEFIHYQVDPNNPNSLNNNRVLSIHEDSSGILWIGTGSGLNRFDPIKETFTHYTRKDGLANGIIYGILEDNHGNLWLSTNKGLSKFNPRTETFKNYTTSDGLQSNEFYIGAYHKSRSGEMFFGGINGFNAFFPDSIRDNPYIPSIVITDFKIFNKSVPIGKEVNKHLILNKSITETKKIKLSYKENAFSFDFAALHYASPEKNEYAYMMEGFD